jgi:hypothetical protein
MGNRFYIAPAIVGQNMPYMVFDVLRMEHQRQYQCHNHLPGFIQTNVAVSTYGRWITTKQQQTTLNGMPVAVFIKLVKGEG